jgi:hydroxymethylglutaryl-CoA lyase
MQFKLPKSIQLTETLLRDGIQNERHFIPTAAKIYFANALTDAGYKNIEVVSLSNPRIVPQFKDAEEVLKGINRKPGVCYIASTISKRAFERAIEATQKGYGPNAASFMISTSTPHSLRNTGQTPDERFEEVPWRLKMAREHGLLLRCCVGTVFGCPIEGPVPMERPIEFTDRFLQMGAEFVQYGDTTGEGTPDKSYEFFCRIFDKYPSDKYPQIIHNAHFHESRGWGLANCLAALLAGVTYFDSSLGGIGGQPAKILDRVPVSGTGEVYTPSDITGNVRSEDLLVMIDEMGIKTDVDVDKVLKIGNLLEEVLERRLKSYCTKTGRIPKGPTGR